MTYCRDERSLVSEIQESCVSTEHIDFEYILIKLKF